jgi:hypothetical protein
VSSSNIPSLPSFADQDRSCLCFTLQAPSLRQAALIAAELRTMAASAVRVHPPAPLLPGRRDWTVALTTAQLSLTLAVVQSWEREMLAVEHRWPGSHLLGWMTCPTPQASIEERDKGDDHDAADERQRLSQRALVMASLLRRAPGERRGIVHGRGAPR